MPYFIGFAEKCGANGESLRPLFLFLQVKSVKASALDLRADRFYSYQSLNGRLRTPETELSAYPSVHLHGVKGESIFCEQKIFLADP
jgi:hypothetical protein